MAQAGPDTGPARIHGVLPFGEDPERAVDDHRDAGRSAAPGSEHRQQDRDGHLERVAVRRILSREPRADVGIGG